MKLGIPLNFKKKEANRDLKQFFVTAEETEECNEDEAVDETQLNYIN